MDAGVAAVGRLVLPHCGEGGRPRAERRALDWQGLRRHGGRRIPEQQQQLLAPSI